MAREKPQLIADELRRRIVTGELRDGDRLGHEPDLVEQFGVSRPSLREALRILEAEGLVTVVRGVQGGVVVREPDERTTARTAALVLRARNVPLADVYEARRLLEPTAARVVAGGRGHRVAARELRALVRDQEAVIDDPAAFGRANARFHERLVQLAGNQTLGVVAEMLHEIVARAVTAASQGEPGGPGDPVATRRRGLRSQEKLVDLVAAGAAGEAEEHWRRHMAVVGKVLLGRSAATVVDLLDDY